MKKILFFIAFTVISVMAFSQVRISQVYGGGGNASATYRNDFIEIFNAGAASVDISAWSVQYASSAGTVWGVTAIPGSTTLAAGKYYLIGQASGGAIGALLPTTDVSGAINLSGSAGKVALVNNSTALSGAAACSATGVQDVLGYGAAASCSETAPFTTVATSVQAYFRKTNGCTDIGNNSSDFEILAVSPRNSSTPANLCSGGAVLNASPSSVTGLQAPFSSPSNEGTYSLSGTGLTGAPGNITITPSVNIEISLTMGGPYGTSALTVPYSSATLTATNVYLRIANTAPLGSFSGTVTNSGGGASNLVVNVTGNVLTTEPTVQASNIIITNIANNSFDINWTNGDGTSRIVVVRPTSATEVVPADGSVYTANTNIATAGTTGSGNFVVFNGTGTGPISVTGLTAGTSYTVRVYEFNGSAGSNNYLTITATNNPASASTTGISPVLQQINFTGNSVPFNMASGGSTRLPLIYYATISGLLPGVAYRYFTQAVLPTDFGTTNSGAGNSFVIDYTAMPVTYTYTSSPSLNIAGGYGKFLAKADGTFTGFFGFVHSTNARFTAGNDIIPSVTLQQEAATATEFRFALNQTIKVLSFGITASPTEGSFIKGASSATPGNVVALWKSTDGSSLVAARPLAMTLVENPTVITGNGGTAWGLSFIAGYDFTAGSWNTIIPNTNPAGVELIQQFNINNGNVIGCNSDADGMWPSGANTVNPTGGSATPIQITATDAPLTGGSCFGIVPVTLLDFSAKRANENVDLTWSTAQELNSSYFDVLRSADGLNWKTIKTVAAAGNSSLVKYYSATDNTPLTGKNLYRLSIADANGRKALSEIRTVLFSDKLMLSVSPNPVKDVINVNYSNTGNKKVQITLMNSTGAVVKTYTTAAAQYKIDAAGLTKGVYILKVSSENLNAVQKVVIQ